MDAMGRRIGMRSFAWSAPKVRVLLRSLLEHVPGDSAVTVGFESEDVDDEMGEAALACGANAKVIEREVVEALWQCMHRRRQTVESRALLIAQLLLLSDYPPVPLETGVRPERW